MALLARGRTVVSWVRVERRPRSQVFSARQDDLGALGGLSFARDIDGHTVVGLVYAGRKRTSHPFFVRLTGLPHMEEIPTRYSDSEAVAVSGSVVIGSMQASNPGHIFDDHAFAYDTSAEHPMVRDLGTLGGTSSRAYDFSQSVVVGSSKVSHGAAHAFAFDLAAPRPHMVDLGTLGGPSSRAVAVDHRVVVGWATTASKRRHAFAYDMSTVHPQLTDLGVIASRSAIGVSGDIVTATKPDGRSGDQATAWTITSTARG